MRRILIALYLLVLMAFVLAGVPLAPFHADESTLIYGTRDYYEQFVTPDLPRIMNQRDDDPMDQELRLLDGRVQTYFSGFIHHLTGGTQDDLNKPWLWGAPLSYNRDDGHLPAPDVLLTHRYATALLAAIGVLAGYGVGAHVGGTAGGLLMATLIVLSPNLMLNGRRVMMEAPLLLFSLLAVLAALRLVEVLRMKAPARVAGVFFALFGLAVGMAVSSKHTAIFTALPLFGALGAWLLRDRRWRGLAALTCAGILSLAVYLALNPAWWPDPFAAAQRMLDLRTGLLESQKPLGPYAGFTDQLRGFVDYALLEYPQYHEVPDWEETPPLIAVYEASPFVLSPLPNLIRAALTFALAAVGTWALIRRRDALAWVTGAWVAFTLAAVFTLTPMSWARYYLPALPALYALAAAGAGALVRHARTLNAG